MRAQCNYGVFDLDPTEEYHGRYTFDVPAGTKVGDVLEDAGQAVTVMRLDSDYLGPVRSLEPPRVVVR